jgi:hypothetical protein
LQFFTCILTCYLSEHKEITTQKEYQVSTFIIKKTLHIYLNKQENYNSFNTYSPLTVEMSALCWGSHRPKGSTTGEIIGERVKVEKKKISEAILEAILVTLAAILDVFMHKTASMS